MTTPKSKWTTTEEKGQYNSRWLRHTRSDGKYVLEYNGWFYLGSMYEYLYEMNRKGEILEISTQRKYKIPASKLFPEMLEAYHLTLEYLESQ